MESVNKFGPELILLALAGIIILFDAAFLARTSEAARTKRVVIVLLALTGAVGSLVWSALLVGFDERGDAFEGMMTVDDFSLFFNFLLGGIAVIIILASVDFTKRHRFQAEYFALLLTATTGLMLLASTVDLIAIFVALELQAISLYVLVAFLKDGRSSESSLKFLLLGAVSTAVTVYGMAYLFGITGSTNLREIAAIVGESGSDERAALVMASVFLAAGLGFKMAVIPFQMWVPDVYEGAPTPITAFLSVASKSAGFAVAMRVFNIALGQGAISTDWATMFAVIAALSMTVGNVTALLQTNIKRMLGYSSIAQAGTFLIGLAAVAANDPQLQLGNSSVIFFLGAYAFTNLAAFLAVIAISHQIGSDQIADYSGVARRSPLLAGGLTLALVSLTGIPPTAGFIAKVYVFNAAVEADLVWLAIIGVINSVISAYYYLRVALNMYTREPLSEQKIQPGIYLGFSLGVAAIGLLVIGVFPSPLIDASEAAARVLG